jgi:hypothetical protein
MAKAEYDAQGKLFWHLARKAGWTEHRMSALLLKRWNVTHWNALTTPQKRAAITMMRGYAAKATKAGKAKSKGIRQAIMALVSRNGYDLDWLHDRMEEWGYGSSMRELNFSQVMSLRTAVIGCFNNTKQGDTHGN